MLCDYVLCVCKVCVNYDNVVKYIYCSQNIDAIACMLKERIVLKAPPMPDMSMKCTWHAWNELVPDVPSKFGLGDRVMCGWKGSAERFGAIIKKVEDRIGRFAEQTCEICNNEIERTITPHSITISTVDSISLFVLS